MLASTGASGDHNALQTEPPGRGFHFYFGLEKLEDELQQRDGGSLGGDGTINTTVCRHVNVWNNWTGLYLTSDQI